MKFARYNACSSRCSFFCWNLQSGSWCPGLDAADAADGWLIYQKSRGTEEVVDSEQLATCLSQLYQSRAETWKEIDHWCKDQKVKPIQIPGSSPFSSQKWSSSYVFRRCDQTPLALKTSMLCYFISSHRLPSWNISPTVVIGHWSLATGRAQEDDSHMPLFCQASFFRLWLITEADACQIHPQGRLECATGEALNSGHSTSIFRYLSLKWIDFVSRYDFILLAKRRP